MNKKRKKKVREPSNEERRRDKENWQGGEKERKAEMNNVHVLFAYMHVRESK